MKIIRWFASWIVWLWNQFPRRRWGLEALVGDKWKKLLGSYPNRYAAGKEYKRMVDVSLLRKNLPGSHYYPQNNYEAFRIYSFISWPKISMDKGEGSADIFIGRIGEEAVFTVRWKWQCPYCVGWHWCYGEDCPDPECPYCGRDELVWPWKLWWIKLEQRFIQWWYLDCPACEGAGQFYGNAEDGEVLVCPDCYRGRINRWQRSRRQLRFLRNDRR